MKDPIDLSEFGSFIKLSCGGSLTPVCGKQFEELKQLIKSRNQIPSYLEKGSAMPIPLKDIDKYNWFDVASEYRHRFMYEIQFRSYYVDYFLKVFGDRKKIYCECECRKQGTSHPPYVDNVIVFGKRYLPVEVKININTEHDLVGQLRKYCYVDKLYLERDQKHLVDNADVIRDKVLVIDTYAVYLYRNEDDSIEKMLDLKDLDLDGILSFRKELLELFLNDYDSLKEKKSPQSVVSDKKAALFEENIPYIESISFKYAEERGYREERTISHEGDRIKIVEDYMFMLPVQKRGKKLYKDQTWPGLLEALKTVRMDEWRAKYVIGEDVCVCDGYSWKIVIKYNNGTTPKRFSGENKIPTGFDRFLEVMEMPERMKRI